MKVGNFESGKGMSVQFNNTVLKKSTFAVTDEAGIQSAAIKSPINLVFSDIQDKQLIFDTLSNSNDNNDDDIQS